jgi:hypothetical protein
MLSIAAPQINFAPTITPRIEFSPNMSIAPEIHIAPKIDFAPSATPLIDFAPGLSFGVPQIRFAARPSWRTDAMRPLQRYAESPGLAAVIVSQQSSLRISGELDDTSRHAITSSTTVPEALLGSWYEMHQVETRCMLRLPTAMAELVRGRFLQLLHAGELDGAETVLALTSGFQQVLASQRETTQSALRHAFVELLPRSEAEALRPATIPPTQSTISEVSHSSEPTRPLARPRPSTSSTGDERPPTSHARSESH